MESDRDVPTDDPIAMAMRGTLDQMGGRPTPSWSHVEHGARRVRRTRIAVACASALVVLLGGAAAYGAQHSSGRPVGVEHAGDPGANSEPTSTTTTSSPSSTTTTIVRGGGATPPPPGGPNGTTSTTVPALPPLAGAQDLSGTLALSEATVADGQPVTATLTITNDSGHAVRLSDGTAFLGVVFATNQQLPEPNWLFMVRGDEPPLAAGASRTLVQTLDALRPEHAGSFVAYAAMGTGSDSRFTGLGSYVAFPHIAGAPFTVPDAATTTTTTLAG